MLTWDLMPVSEPSTEEQPIFRPPAEAGAPVELELADGSRLVLEPGGSGPVICRVAGHECERIDLHSAMRLRGQPFAGYRFLGPEDRVN